MPSLPCRMPALLSASLLAAALCGCSSTQEAIRPSVADLTPSPEPILPDEALTSAAALDAYDIAIRTWGQNEHGKLVRVCEWHKRMGARDLKCM